MMTGFPTRGSSADNEALCPAPVRTDWRGAWIWVPESAGYPWRNSYALFRRRFAGGGAITIDIAADTRYDLFLDGRRVDRGTAPSVAAYKAFDTHRVSVEPGQHVVAVMVHHIGEVCATAERSRPGLLAEISVEEGEDLFTDSRWKVIPGRAFEQALPEMMSHFGFAEVCNCAGIPEGWTGIDCDDSGWMNAEVIGAVGRPPWSRLVARDIPLLETRVVPAAKVLCRGAFASGQVSAEVASTTVAAEMSARRRTISSGRENRLPVDIGRGRDEFIALDFGREVTGHVRILLSNSDEGRRVDVGYDELLDARGLPDPRRTYVHFADRFYLRRGQDTLEVFDARGFRYLVIDVAAGVDGMVISGVEVDERTYPIQAVGSFRCSDAGLNRLYEIGLETTRLCMLDTYVDCPSRERVMWMDSYIEGLCSSYGMGITELWRRSLYIFAQNPSRDGVLDGAIRGFAPTDREAVAQVYVLYYVCSLSDYVLHSGDIATGEALFETAMRQIRIMRRFTDSSGIIGDGWPNWLGFLDWSAMDYGGVSAATNAVYMVAMRKLARLARHLGRDDESSQLLAECRRLAPVYRKTFWAQADGLFVDAINDGVPSNARSQVCNALAIWANVVSQDEARGIIARITDTRNLLPPTPGDYRLKPGFRFQTGGIVPAGTPVMGTVVARGVFEVGLDVQALDYVRENWSALCRNGTYAEHFCFDDNTNMCHGWGAGPVLLLPRYVLGIKPVDPGWKTVEVSPHTSGLAWATGTVRTPRGEIAVSWQKAGEKVSIDVDAPDGIDVIRADRRDRRAGPETEGGRAADQVALT